MIKLLSISLLFFGCSTSKIIVDATPSYDPDGWIVGQKLEQVSGSKATIKETNRLKYEIILPKKGVYVFRITVTDNDSAKATRVIQKTKF